MNIPEFKGALRVQLSKISTDEVIVFAQSICNRLLPHYQDFYEQNQWGSPPLLSECMRLCGIINRSVTNQKDTLLGLAKQLEEIIPDTEEFADGSLALNAAASVQELVEFIVDQDLDHILHISSYMIDTVDFMAWEEGASFPVVTERVSQEMKYQLELTKKQQI